MPVDPSALAAAKAAIDKQYGAQAIHIGSETPPVPRIPFSSPELNYATGGGVPKGRWSRFYGAWSSGKSLNCWDIIANAQAMGMTCAYYNVEKQYDPVFTESQGVCIDDLLIVEGTTIEEIGTKLEVLLGAVHVHVIDSASSAVSIDELNSKVEDWHMGLGPRAWGKVMRRALERFDQFENTGIIVDQVRTDFKTGAEGPPGGRFLEHTSSLSLHFKRGKWLFYDKDGVLDDKGAPQKPGTLSGTAEADGVEYQVRVQKSRVGRPFRSARMRLDLNSMEFDRLYELTKAAKHFGIVETSGSWIVLPDGEKIQGNSKLRARLEEDAELRKLTEDTIQKAA